MYKIGFCGSHGTGKTTLLETISDKLDIPIINKTIRTYWASIGVNDFEKLPANVRTQCQLRLLLNQIEREDTEGKDGFITDRSVLDYIGYTAVSSDMSGGVRGIYEQLIRERLSNYTHFIYIPVEFEAKKEHLRADPSSQVAVAQAIEHYLSQWMEKDQYIVARGSIEERLAHIYSYLGI